MGLPVDFGIKGLTIAPPVIGRISIGKRVERDGKTLPAKDDQFTLTTQSKIKGVWQEHPLQEDLEEKLPPAKENAEKKLRDIPVMVMFDDKNLNVRSEYTAFSKEGRPVCVGNGEKARRFVPSENKTDEVICTSPDTCEFGINNRCKPYGRVGLQIEGQNDETAVFMFRTTGFNSISAVHARLSYFHGITGGKLAGFPMTLKLRGKSTAQSMGSPIFYVDLTVREGMTLIDAVKKSQAFHEEWEKNGLSREFFEEAARQGLANGMYENNSEDGMDIIEEFYSFGAEDEESFVDLRTTGNGNSLASTLANLIPGAPESTDEPPELPDSDKSDLQSEQKLPSVKVELVSVDIDENLFEDVSQFSLSSPVLPPVPTDALADSMSATELG